MANRGKSEPGLFGTIHHYDEHGREVGRSEPGLFGGYTNYDAHGRRVGHSDPGLFGGYDHYDDYGRRIGRSEPGLFGSYRHTDSRGRSVGSSEPGMFGYHHSDKQGCYVATCVYGSYDCPEVWTLRRFRDDTLAAAALGRAFIHAYYAVSPTIVKWFGRAGWFRWLWRGVLDQMVQRLWEKGVEDTPYRDQPW